jgi:excisionase family DNA binding protein
MAFHVSEACEQLRISRSTLTKLAVSGEIRIVRLGCRIVVPASEIERLLAGEARP